MCEEDWVQNIKKVVKTQEEDLNKLRQALKQYEQDNDPDKLIAAYNKYRMFKGKIE